MPTTSAKPRYALTPDFAGLFDPELSGDALEAAVGAWQNANLSSGALARIALVRGQAVASDAGILISFPSGETRRMVAGPSSTISKAVIEEFAPRFLEVPGVVFLSESANKIVTRDDQLARRLGLRIERDRTLPDIDPGRSRAGAPALGLRRGGRDGWADRGDPQGRPAPSRRPSGVRARERRLRDRLPRSQRGCFQEDDRCSGLGQLRLVHV